MPPRPGDLSRLPPHPATLDPRRPLPPHPATSIQQRPLPPHPAKLGPQGSPGRSTVQRAMSHTTLATNFQKQKRPSASWPKRIKDEVMYEASVLAADNAEQALLKQYQEAKDYLSDIRHKVSWEYVKTAAINAVKNQWTAPVNNIIALAGRFDLDRVTAVSDLGSNESELVAWVNDVANSVPNVYWGNAKINRGLGEKIDLHFHDDFLGESYHKPKDPGSTPFSRQLSLQSFAIFDYIAGTKGLSSAQLEDIWKGVTKHYKVLRDLAEAHKQPAAKKHFAMQYEESRTIGDGWLDMSDDFIDIDANT